MLKKLASKLRPKKKQNGKPISNCALLNLDSYAQINNNDDNEDKSDTHN